MKITLLLLSFLPTLTFAAYIPPVQRYQATHQQGRNGETDTAVLDCKFDIIRFYPRPGETWIMLMLFSDPLSRVSFRPMIPASILPLQDGATWTDGNGRGYEYTKGFLKSLDGEISYEIDGHFLFPIKAEGLSQGEPGRSGSFLRCEF